MVEILGEINSAPIIEYLSKRIPAMQGEELVQAFQIVRSQPGGKRAIARYLSKLSTEEKKMFRFINAIAAPFDLLNSALERIVEVVYLLP